MPFLVLAMPCVQWCNLSRCVDANGTKFTNLFLFNEKLLHLVDDIFWHLCFKSSEHAEKVMSQIINYCDYCNYCDYFHYFRWESIMTSLSLHESVWVNKLHSKRYSWSGCRIPSDFAWWLCPLPLAEKICWRTGAERSAGWNCHGRQDCCGWSSTASAACRLWYAQWKGCHHQDVPLFHAKAFGNEANQPTCCWLGNRIIIK